MSHQPRVESEGMQALPVHPAPEVVPPKAYNQTWNIDSAKESNNSPYPFSDHNQHYETKPRTICGVRKTTLILGAALILATVAAVVVGILLGSGSKNSSSNCISTSGESSLDRPISSVSSSATSSPTSSLSTASTTSSAIGFTAPSPITVALDCPSLDGTTRNNLYPPTGKFVKYSISCGYDCTAHDIMTIWSYSLDMCVQSCLSFTRDNATDLSCGAVAFRYDMGNVTGLGGNCYLKWDACSVPVKQDALVASAVLLSLPF